MTRVGVVVPQGWRLDLEDAPQPFETMVSYAREAEALGFDSVWLYDHFQPRDGRLATTFECWTSLAAIARETSRVRLGQLVTCAAYRNPALLAKMASTVDAASGGRALVGVGAGWDENEWTAYGYPLPFPPIGDRLRHLEATLQTLHAMWTEVPAHGGRARGAVNVPQRRLPILVGGAGERVLLRLVAQYADACNLTDHTDPGFYRRKLEVLRRRCDEVGRDYDAIARTASFTVRVTEGPAEPDPSQAVGTPEQLVEVLGGIVEAGIQEFVLYFADASAPDGMRAFARDVMPRLARE